MFALHTHSAVLPFYVVIVSKEGSHSHTPVLALIVLPTASEQSAEHIFKTLIQFAAPVSQTQLLPLPSSISPVTLV